MDKLLFALFSIVFGFAVMAAPAPVGKVSSLSGTLEANQSTILKKGSEVFEGDVLSLKDGQAKILFADKAEFTLKPGTEIKIDAYSLKAKEEKSWITLLKGGFRTVTGLIAKKNPDGYKVETPVATIGVRGTVYRTFLSDPNTLYVKREEGKKVQVANDLGSLELGSPCCSKTPQGSAPQEISNQAFEAAESQFDQPCEIF